ncbi:MAG: hypothetical protein ACE5Q6_08365 [Dehalococcoidia bacterium]
MVWAVGEAVKLLDEIPDECVKKHTRPTYCWHQGAKVAKQFYSGRYLIKNRYGSVRGADIIELERD